MRLKKIKLAGFKSFVDPTTIPFPDDMTAVVGPNGCGKSNVIDAVRWVLGESSAKNLRGDAMTDVIFNGSTSRKPVSVCSVELLFDNSSGRIKGEYAGYNELSVKRIVTKESKSSYLLNNSKCRRRDVTDLFLGTGLGPRSYAIIEQGMISRLIESKPQELRVFIEEAAGVSKYKERRRETETRIRHTKENLERLDDVRGELGQQLEKLQRQALVAKRFKQLKQSERQYKAELWALRWLKHNKKIQVLETDITQRNADIEAYVTSQRSNEKNITQFKEQQQDIKQKQADIQQSIFKVGSDISRIEQNQIHNKQRRQQVEHESNSLHEAINNSENNQQQNLQTIDDVQQKLQLAIPERQLLDEQVVQSENALFDAEESLNQQQLQWRSFDQNFHLRKQQAQSCHGKIQSLMSMQMRTQQRIGELKDELSEVVDEQLVTQIDICQQKITLLAEQSDQAAQSNLLNDQTLQVAKQSLKQKEQIQLNTQGQLQSIEAQLAALHSLQQARDEQQTTTAFLKEQRIEYQKWWQTLDIQPGWEKAFETITQHWHNAFVLPSTNIQRQLTQVAGASWLFADKCTGSISQHSIASKMQNGAVPYWMTDIYYVENLEQALVVLPTLAEHQSVISQEGCWMGQGWMIVGTDDDQAGLLQRANQIKALELEKQKVSKILSTDTQAIDLSSELLNNEKKKSQDNRAKLDDMQQRLQQTQNQLQLYEQQQNQSVNRNERLSQELARHQVTFEQERQDREKLCMQAEELEQAVELLHNEQGELEQQREQNHKKVTNSRAMLDSSKNKLHQLALHLQGLHSQYDALKANQTRDGQQLIEMQQKLALLESEFIELGLPLEEQAQHLQQLLEQGAELNLFQNDFAVKLSLVEDKLYLAEKGQQAVTDKIQVMLTELQSIKLECEGFRVRANGVLEQLHDMQQNIKPLLENLPEKAEEKYWQALLDKTIASLNKLGAVNLAAVEEYEVQAQRKQHLDEQNQDLVSALEILEQAIRKIDKETRDRFKQTFDSVNEDLRLLFPKVFGGGTAYLELTDHDLLETGVTIMARPPGKKNSTIHLLSGGEKALTALSLVFAIFRLNPAPFCLLDEVDAPLDDANVGRFCNLVSEMSKSVQFIYITHNKIAMEMATHLTGVTMVEPGVSRMVAVDVEEAMAIVQA
jgi:chromosome segregation protein